MARTPLGGVLRRIAADTAEASRLGVDADEVAARRLSRRDLLEEAGKLGAAATLLSSPAFLAGCGGGKEDRPEIAIVGAGIAGLTAALTLADKGIRATVYESSDRVGGRMHTLTNGYWGEGHYSEWCGELIDTDMVTTRKLCKRYGLQLLDLPTYEPPRSFDTYYFFGGYYPHTQVLKDFLPVFRAVTKDLRAAGNGVIDYRHSNAAARKLDRMTMYDWIETRVPGGHDSRMGQLLDVAYNQENGAQTQDQSALSIVTELGPGQTRKFSIYGESDQRFHIKGGNQQLPQAIADDLPEGTIEHGRRLTAVRQEKDKVILSFGGDEVRADYAILTLPFAVLRTLDYARAGFDARKRRAIERIGAGRNTKFLLEYSQRLWDEPGPWGRSDGTSYSDRGYMTTWNTTLGQPGKTGILVNYTGGDVAGSFRPAKPYTTAADDPLIQGYARRLLRQFEPVYPGISKLWNGKATLSTPFLDPNLLCSYSYVGPGQTTTIVGYERVPQGRIHFAGEHCSINFRGFMEGGAETGMAAAREVLAKLA